MLRITVELIPFGDESRKREIARGEIVNDGTGDRTRGNYRAELHTDRTAALGVTLRSFPRATGVWNLVRQILNSAHEHGLLVVEKAEEQA